ncbi:MAG: hypothetical protein IK083_01190 [Abditibacteriota bacterium]|nr:hypothetical protein [Abditibacteriota bacterium]
MKISGTLRLDKRTKRLAKRLKKNEIALIDHTDLDSTAALMLVEAQAACIINVARSSSGRYPNLGPLKLLEHDIPLIDNADPAAFDILHEGDKVVVDNGSVYRDGELVVRGELLTKEAVDKQLEDAAQNLGAELEAFINNTLNYMSNETNLILYPSKLPDLETSFTNRHCLVVIRGENYKEDLKTIRSYIHDMKPVLIGVDGGADALIELGFKPDIIVGDMDSVTDNALLTVKEIVVHAYTNGKAPGLERTDKLGLKPFVCPITGTSEDLALLIAYEKGASLITAVGTHSDMIDFLDKGRNGMSSTFLTRLKVGHRLVDAKGVSKLYVHRPSTNYVGLIVLAAIIALFTVIAIAPNSIDYMQGLYHNLYSFFLNITIRP